jgi:hypothetical protein
LDGGRGSLFSVLELDDLAVSLGERLLSRATRSHSDLLELHDHGLELANPTGQARRYLLIEAGRPRRGLRGRIVLRRRPGTLTGTSVVLVVVGVLEFTLQLLDLLLQTRDLELLGRRTIRSGLSTLGDLVEAVVERVATLLRLVKPVTGRRESGRLGSPTSRPAFQSALSRL